MAYKKEKIKEKIDVCVEKKNRIRSGLKAPTKLSRSHALMMPHALASPTLQANPPRA
jgi:hypothetical protein